MTNDTWKAFDGFLKTKYPEEYKANFLFKSEISDTLANDTEDVSDVVGFYQFLQMLSNIWDQLDDEPKKTN